MNTCVCCGVPIGHKASFAPGHDAKIMKLFRSTDDVNGIPDRLIPLYLTWMDKGRPSYLKPLVDALRSDEIDDRVRNV